MKKWIVKLLTRLKIIHGGPAKIRDYGRNLFFFSITCWKCNSEMDILWDDDVEPGLWAILCGEPWKLIYPYCDDDKSIWHWDGETWWYEISNEAKEKFWSLHDSLD